MKAKTITLSVLAALYAAGVSATASELAAPKSGFKSIAITDQIVQFNQNLTAGTSRNGVSHQRNASQSKNTHRALGATQQQKIPFKHELGLTGERLYIVELSDEPTALYRGGVQGLAATNPRMNQAPALLARQGTMGKLDTKDTNVINYTNYLKGKRDNVISRLQSITGKAANVKAEYSMAFNGFAVKMTQEQAAQVAQMTGVRQVVAEKMYDLHTDVGPEHIGADQIWTGGVGRGEYQGEGIVIGVIDTGINSDHPSFAKEAGDGYVHQMPARYSSYLGDCQAFEDMCNDKLIGVRSYPIITDSFSDYIFPSHRPENGEDYNGHGSHTASTAAGNVLFDVDYLVPELIEQGDGLATGLVFPQVSGVAPRANIIAYQVCFPGDRSYGDEYAGCPSSALIASIEDAIEDGVDVINFSIGSQYGENPWQEPVELSFLAAREAGISVAASAGNSFVPEAASQARGAIDHLSPWLTSVAASTHGREITVEGKAITGFVGGDDTLPDIVGGGITGSYTGPVVKASDYGWQYERCNDAFDDGFFSVDPDGNPFTKAPIVVCERGDIPRVSKAINVAQGGAGGFILYNASSTENIANDAYAIPGILISNESYYGTSENNRFGLEDWLRSGEGHEITITESQVTTKVRQADYVGDFSSRGPNQVVPDIMTPNVAAPGVDVYAAWADEQPFTALPQPTDYTAISGTSMAAPHVAGAMALLKQAHNDWSPAQIQSALMMTASIESVTRARDNNPFDPVPAGYNDAGSGVINVARATKAGLLLDETAANYRAADPENGGTMTNLNVPFLFNDSCEGSCTWMRTFTATTDGTWDVSASSLGMDGLDMLSVDVTPKIISLKAGESQAISVTANILEIGAPNADSSQVQLFGRVDIKPRDLSLPDQYLPMGVRFADDNLPNEVSGIIHRSQGHTLTPEIITDEIQSFNHVVYGLSKAQQFNWKIPMAEYDKRAYMGNEDYAPLTRAELEEASGVEVIFFDVPEGTKRIVWEVQSIDEPHAYASIDLGMDLNGDEDIQWNDEAICYSHTGRDDFCAVNNPTPGKYWAIAANWKFVEEDESNNADNFIVNLAIVSSENSDNLTIEIPENINGLTPFQAKLNYNLEEANEGDAFYGVVGLGSDDFNNSNLGEIPVKLIHHGSDVSIDASQTSSKVGDIVEYQVTLAPNLLGGERDFNITTRLPENLELLEDSIVIGGVGNYQEGLMVEGQVISIDASQASSADVRRHYAFTTNAEDEMCKVPYGDNPNFYDLGLEGYTPIELSGFQRQVLYIPMETNGLPHVPLYGNSEVHSRDVLGISPFGYVQFDPMPTIFNMHLEFNDSFQIFPDTMVAPLWRGDVYMPDNLYFDWDKLKYMNAVYAVITDDHYIFQWDGAEEYFRAIPNADPDAYYNIETIISTDITFEPGDYEIIYAYESLNSTNNDLGSIGIHGYWGERGTFGPAYGYLNDGFAYNDVNTKVSNGTVICADYRGPEQTQLDLTFKARVLANAIGAESVVVVDSQFSDSELVTVSHTLATPSNITVSSFADVSIAENTSLEDIAIIYNDNKGTVNGIEVTGEHVTAVVSGNTSGSTFTVTPDANWYGETQISVTVYDMAYPEDKDTATFTLTVLSDGINLGCTDSSATNYDDKATTDNGTCEYPPASKPSTPAKSTSSGGTYGWMMLLVLSLFAARKVHKTK
ncbi:S8 family serine peptidase [Thalassotalea sp. PLHSN55]|uniref:S8 family serine peptidase n=1 Tax=Thalassotalea sp. PLHSN55 TaxID=3435888 RepID=UPI003F8737BE